MFDGTSAKHRVPTRAAAVRELLKLGLTVLTGNGRSSDYGVFSRGPDGHTSGSDRDPAAWRGDVFSLRGLSRQEEKLPRRAAACFAHRASRQQHLIGLGMGKWCPGKDSNLHGR
ncbi:hypothetical protein ACFIOY_06140 [Bradyrhizobium sp. TZ2]